MRICSNPDCQTVHVPVGTEAEKYCIRCGQPLNPQPPTLLLKECDLDKFSYIPHVIELHLIHPNIHPPVAAFQEEFNSSTRYCLITPVSNDLPFQTEVPDVMDWGIQLAQALDYMQAKGLALGEELDQSSIGIADGKPVWRNFSNTRILPLLTDREKINNLRQLALAMYYWMTGKTNYSLDPYLPASLNDLFQKALVGEGFSSGVEFARLLTQAKASGANRLNLDYQLGRRSHPGKVRKNNEDSLLCMDLSRMSQGIIQPICLVAVADGMGGHASGELASNKVIEAIAQIGAFELVALQKIHPTRNLVIG